MWEMLAQEFSTQGQTPLPLLALRLAGTIVLCGIIGIEREIMKDSAGLRTNILVGVAAATFAMITTSILDSNMGQDNNVRSDPLRLVEAVTNGVTFLAAGIIVFAKGEVRGLTTGAGMWLSASVGLSVGLGFWMIAVMTGGAGFIVLTALRRLEVRFGTKDG